MQRNEVIDTATTPDGSPISLNREGSGLVVRVGRVPLMASRVHGSEALMAVMACEGLADRSGVRVLVGGLGMGYTLRATLDALAPDAKVVVVELLPAVVAWHAGPLGPLADHPLEDPRVDLIQGDLVEHLKGGPKAYDAILLDVDNGPESLTVEGNERLYSRSGLRTLRGALQPRGVLAVWSAFQCRPFEQNLERSGFQHEVRRVRARGEIQKGSRHLVFLARPGGRPTRPSTPPPSRRRR